MRLWLAALVLLALAALAGARWLSAPLWVDALMACFLFASLAVGVALGLGARRLAAQLWKAPLALVLGGGAAAGRLSLTHWASARPDLAGVITPGLPLAIATVAWGGLALVWGAAALAESMDPGWPATGPTPSRRRRRVLAAGAGLAVALALYCLAPLGALLGLRVNHWTVLGLFGLAAAAYGVGRIYSVLARRAR